MLETGSPPPRDPWATLGLEPGSDAGALRAAYLARVREHPPDRDPEAFQQIREAYEALTDPDRLLAERVFGLDLTASLAALVEEARSCPKHTGPEPWLAVLREW